MAGRIPQPFIDEIIARADLVELIGTRVELKKAGREFKGLCPFHGEKTPSFTVSPDKGFFHCFGCGAHGTALGFLMDYDNLSFVEAVEALAETVGLEVPREQSSEPRERHSEILSLLAEADQLFRGKLKESVEAIEYLKYRGLDGATAARFGIGFAPDAWDTLLSELGRNDNGALLMKAGLVIENERGRRYDRFRNRITFPIRDHRGRVIGFGGRALGDGEPKYLNSPETAVFHKGQALYGLYEARQSRANLDRILVVEGYLDVASLAQHGIPYAVATLGTATTKDHLTRLARLASRVVFCFDGDRAGRAAAWRAMETALPQARGTTEFGFLFLPDGEDPDSLVRKEGAGAFERRLQNAESLATFLVSELASDIDGTTVDGRARLAERAKPMLARVPVGVYRDLLLEALGQAVGLSPARLATLLTSGTEAPRPTRGASSRPMPLAGRSSLIRQAIALVLHFPASSDGLDPAPLRALDQPGAQLLARLLETIHESPHITTAGLLERFRNDPEGQHLGRLLKPPQDSEGASRAVLKDCLARIESDYKRQRLAELTALGADMSPDEKQEYQELVAGPGEL